MMANDDDLLFQHSQKLEGHINNCNQKFAEYDYKFDKLDKQSDMMLRCVSENTKAVQSLEQRASGAIKVYENTVAAGKTYKWFKSIFTDTAMVVTVLFGVFFAWTEFISQRVSSL